MNKEKMKNWIISNIFKIAVFLLLLGFGLMAADNLWSNTGNSIVAMTVAPIVLLMAYSLIIFAILKRPF